MTTSAVDHNRWNRSIKAPAGMEPNSWNSGSVSMEYTTSTYGLARSPPFAPWPCRCTRTMVASTMAYSMSGSPLTASNRRTKTSAFTQSRKRLNTVFHLPKCSGKSRQGLLVRTIHKTASTTIGYLSRFGHGLRPCLSKMGSYEPIVELSKRIESHQDFAWSAEQPLKSPQTLAVLKTQTLSYRKRAHHLCRCLCKHRSRC